MEHAHQAVNCLNHMICNALEHAEHCLEYLALVDPAVLRFSAIAQVMALATLATCWDNHKVFTGAQSYNLTQLLLNVGSEPTIVSDLMIMSDSDPHPYDMLL